MIYTLHVRPAAEKDIDSLATYIARDNLEVALQFYDAVDATFRQIRDHPKRWPRYELLVPRLNELRKCTVVKFRHYLVFYQVHDQSIDVLRVLHGARDILSVLETDLPRNS